MILELALLTVSILFIWKYHQRASKWSHFPGFGHYTSLPIIGHAYKIGTRPIEMMETFRKKFGDVFRLDLGASPTIIFSDYEEAIEVMRSEVLNARPDKMYVFDIIRRVDDKGQQGGIIMAYGQQWKDLRRFVLQQLSDLALGKKDTLADIINQEAQRFCDRLESQVKRSSNVSFHKKFMPSSNNAIWRILTGKDTDVDDLEVRALSKAVADIFVGLDQSNPSMVIQSQNKWCYLIAKYLGLSTVVDKCMPVINLLKAEITKYQPDFDGNYIERHLAQMQKHKDDKDSVFCGQRGDIHLVGTLFDLFNAGTDTSSTILEWSLLYLTENPDVQQKVFEEIKSQIGTLRPPNLHDKQNTPYAMAVLEEVMRLCPLAFLTVPKMALEDVSIKGRFYPKGTVVFANAWAIHRNSKYFSNPEDFNPDRFLKEGRFESSKYLCTFGMGKRRCPGEVLGRSETYIFLTSMLQRFQFTKIEGQPSLDEYMTGMVVAPKPFQLEVKLRNL